MRNREGNLIYSNEYALMIHVPSLFPDVFTPTLKRDILLNKYSIFRHFLFVLF